MKIHVIHGIRTRDSRRSIGRIAPYFEQEGYEVVVHDYGYIRALETYWRNRKIAARIAKSVGPGDVLIGHSNGCDIIRRIAAGGTRFTGAVLFNAALDRDTKFAAGIDWIDVYHTHGDRIVTLARLLPWHSWGSMGREGYKGSDPRVTNIAMCAQTSDHSEIVEDMAFWAPRVLSRVQIHLTLKEVKALLESVAKKEKEPA
jgi:hypothetical protein